MRGQGSILWLVVGVCLICCSFLVVATLCGLLMALQLADHVAIELRKTADAVTLFYECLSFLLKGFFKLFLWWV